MPQTTPRDNFTTPGRTARSQSASRVGVDSTDVYHDATPHSTIRIASIAERAIADPVEDWAALSTRRRKPAGKRQPSVKADALTDELPDDIDIVAVRRAIGRGTPNLASGIRPDIAMQATIDHTDYPIIPVGKQLLMGVNASISATGRNPDHAHRAAIATLLLGNDISVSQIDELQDEATALFEPVAGTRVDKRKKPHAQAERLVILVERWIPAWLINPGEEA